MRYRAINYSEVNARRDKAPVFLFGVFKKNNNTFKEISSIDAGVTLIIIKEVDGVFFCYYSYYKGEARMNTYGPVKQQAYEFILIPETHPLFNFKHAARNVPNRDDRGILVQDDPNVKAQTVLARSLRAFSIKEGQKLQALYTKQDEI